MATVKSFRLKGYVNDALCLSVDMRINSFKLAEKRFRARYEGVLVGSWRIDVLLDNKQVHSFMLNQLELFQPNKRNKLAPKEEQTSSLSGVNPCIRAGRLAMIVLERVYSDGMLPLVKYGKQVIAIKYLHNHDSWHGRGRKPKWFVEYQKSGKLLSDISINLKDCDY
ncbi:MAG TPA: hypothetical protein ENJ51_00095 [Leucothrix mucor]|uniref:DNA-binding protein H-NS-like C-terminal domain-containing protein n=1 Tax=Leucothrix mucor TaxID=45248 RepID=A0A7V2WU03_LEUMU|nr:hypothetical protein [Leucothrix mucor]